MSGFEGRLFLDDLQEAYPDAAIIGGVVMGRRIVARREHGALSGGRGVGALAISGNAPLFAMTCLGDKNVLKSESILLVVSFFCL